MPTSLSEPSQPQTCTDAEYRSENGICCNKCVPGNVWTRSPSWARRRCHTSSYTDCENRFSKVEFDLCFPGYRLVQECTASGRRSTCMPCPSRQFQETINYSTTCRTCSICKSTVQWSLAQQRRLSRQFSSGWMSICRCPLFFLFPQHQRTMMWFCHVTRPKTPFVAAGTVFTSLSSIQQNTSASDANPAN